MSNLVSILDHTMPHILTDSQSNMTQAQYLTNGNHVNGVSKSHLTNGVAKPQPQVTQSATKSDHVWTSMRCMDEPRPLKLIYVGGGISGICGAIEFIKQVPDLEMVIYEKNPELGGTWYENRYPGCACDVPAHAYQLASESSPKWTSFYATAPEILQYWKDVADKYNVRQKMKFSQKVTGARWSETAGKWFVQIHDLNTEIDYEDSADVLMTGEGVLNEWKWPEIPGIHSFKGELLHSAAWDTNIDLEDKAVAVIGAGSSGLQIVPSILPKVKSMDHYIRGRSWIAGFYGGTDKTRVEEGGGNFDYTDEEKEVWANDREAYLQYRRAIEYGINNRFGVLFSGSKQQADMRLKTEESMMQRLKSKPEIYNHILPEYSPYCKRLSPGPGYLEALGSPKVNTITAAITGIDESGIITSDGKHHPVDVIVCATGFQTSPANRSFPIYGKGDINLRERFQARPETYLGVCTDGFPNFFQSMGPNALPGAGSLLLVIEKTHAYVAKILRRMAYENIGRVEAKSKCVKNFTNYCDEFFKRTVFAEECNSWYKTYEPGATREEQSRGRVTAIWPGSSLHIVKTLCAVRWEDFELKYHDDNEFGWFGNGWTMAEKYPVADLDSLTWYLDETKMFLHKEQK